jgi:S-adenosylmethionine:tRNA ribosyltransferase-isomerase
MTGPANAAKGLRVADFDFHLPEELIAQQPPTERGASRMLVVNRDRALLNSTNRSSNDLAPLPPTDLGSKEGTGFSPYISLSEETGALAPEEYLPEPWRDALFADLHSLLNPGDLLVLNDSRVIPARLFARRSNARGKQEPSGLIEVLLTSPDAAGNWNAPVWRALVRPGRKVRVGDHLEFHPEGTGATDRSGPKESSEGAGAFRPLNQHQVQAGFSPGNGEPLLRAEVIASGNFGERTLRFAPVNDFYAALEQIGHMPLPPYIKREDATNDRERYQTVFAQHRGSVAAPTAGLHFTPSVLEAIKARDVEIAKITLHVGLGTFAPLRVERVDEIHLHSERYTLSAETAEALNRARKESRRIVAVGTTTVRTLEHCAQIAGASPLQPHTGETSIFISPGYDFRIVNAMLTNFHLPQSSLLMLVSAFAGRERVLAAYAHAVQEQYRFFSYGDCMLIR